MTNELTGWVSAVAGAVQHIQQWPVSVLIIAVLIVIGAVLKYVEVFPNRWIPIVVLALGSAGNAIIGNPGSVSPDQRYPGVVLALHGFLLGFIAWALHAFALKRIEKFVPFLKSTETEK